MWMDVLSAGAERAGMQRARLAARRCIGQIRNLELSATVMDD